MGKGGIRFPATAPSTNACRGFTQLLIEKDPLRHLSLILCGRSSEVEQMASTHQVRIRLPPPAPFSDCGCSSMVGHDFAKVEFVGSSPISRSI